MSFEKNANDNIFTNQVNQKCMEDKKCIKHQRQLLQESEYSSETDQEIIENNSIDFDFSLDEKQVAHPRQTQTQKQKLILTEHPETKQKYSKNKNNHKNIKQENTHERVTFSRERIEKLVIPMPHVNRVKKTPTEAANDLFKKAIKTSKKPNLSKKKPQSTKASEMIYEKFVNQNEEKSKNVDLFSKFQDEEAIQNREATRSKENVKIINDLLNRQEEFEKVKLNKLKEKEKEVNDKKFQECIFNPNGIYTTSRTPVDFYNEQLKFVEKKDDKIKKLTKDILENEKIKTSVLLTSKTSDKIASMKNPHETKEQLYNRLAEEKLGQDNKIHQNESHSNKKMTKEELKNLSNKLYNEGQTFKNNLDKKRKEKILQEEKNNKKEFALEKSNKVILDKFISGYYKILFEIFNQTNNFEISFDDYKKILYRLCCIKPNSNSDDNLVKDSFYNYLKPNNDKISTYSFLLFALAAFGIYKGNDEKILENKNNKNKNKTSIELIKAYIPDLDFEKYGFNNKIAKHIKLKFMHFISGVNEMWADDLTKKKQERLDKTEEILKKQEQQKKIANRERIKNLLAENLANNNQNNNQNENTIKSAKLEDNYLRIQKKQKQNLTILKAKYDAKELENCTFQPNSLTKPVNKNKISKNIEKLYADGKKSYIKKKQMSDRDRDENDDNVKNCTFKPQLHHYNKQVFNNNPLKEDKNYNNKIQKSIRAKKIKDQKYEKPMNFSLEPKLNKETMFERISTKKSIQSKNIDYGENKGYNFKEGVMPLLKIEVNLDEKNNSDKLFIYPGDDVIKITNKFCMKHKLKEEKKNTLLMTILEKIQENENIKIQNEAKDEKIKNENSEEIKNKNINNDEKNEIKNEIHNDEDNLEENEIHNEEKNENIEESFKIEKGNQNEEENFEQKVHENQEQSIECEVQNEGNHEENEEQNENGEIKHEQFNEGQSDENIHEQNGEENIEQNNE